VSLRRQITSTREWLPPGFYVAGYYWAGWGTLYQEQQTRLRWLKQRRLELKTAR